eukprot:TRINITY_DN66706_c7_g2_i3.p1 TRINITY_DN66706_c7_g2~~TRINITY_DN66706_c7_g2_i3.p1  ORF type:complete len:439 (+),score=86.71 TRINITY_DN66706_c7_g2_i3:115-1431(+)
MLRLTVMLAVVFVVAAWPAAAQVMGNNPWMGASQTNVYFNNGPTYGSDHGHYGKDYDHKDDYYKSRMSMTTVHVLTSEAFELLDTIKWARNSIRMMCHVNDVEFHVTDSMEDQAMMWKADVESKWPKLHLNILSNPGLDMGLKDHLYADLSDAVTFKTLRPLDAEAVEAFVRDDMLFAIPQSFRSLSFITINGAVTRPANANDLTTAVTNGQINLRFLTDDPIYAWGIMNMVGAIDFSSEANFNADCGGGQPLENFFNYIWNLGLIQRNRGGPKLFDTFEQTLVDWKAGTINTVVDGNWAYAHYKALQPDTTAWNGPAGFRPFRFYSGVAFNPLMDHHDAMAAHCVAKVLTGKDQQSLLQSMGGVVPVNLDVIAATPLAADLQSFVDDVEDFPVANAFFLDKFFGDEFEATWTDLWGRIDAGNGADAEDLLRDNGICP